MRMLIQRLKLFLNKKGIVSGVIAGIISSLCCVTPLVLIFLGLGTVSFAFSFVAYKTQFLVASLIFLAGATWFFLRKEGCRLTSFKAKGFLVSSLVVYLVIFFGLLYVLVPTLGPKVYEARLFAQDLGDHPPSCHLGIKLVGLDLKGLTCESCAAAVKYALEQKEGVIKAEVDLEREEALVHYENKKISPQEIIQAIPSSYQVEKVIDYC